MSHLKEDFETHLLNDLHPIAEQEESFEQENHISQNSFIIEGNSFILDKNMFSKLSENNENLNISDHTLSDKEHEFHIHPEEHFTVDEKMLKKLSHTKELDDGNAMESEEFKNSSKLEDELLSEDHEKSSIIQEGYDEISNEPDGSSFNIMEQEISSSGTGSTRGRRKFVAEEILMGHKDHMLLGSKVISGLEKNIVSLPFREPVDIERFNIPDYHEIVKEPMDLRTIKRKISSSSYETIQEIYADIELIIENSMKYNEFNADFIRLTKNFQKSYYKIRRDCERNLKKFKIKEDKRKNDFPQIKSQKDIQVPSKISKTALPTKNVHHLTTQFPTNDVEISSNFGFSELIKLARRIKKIQPQEQIELFKKIGIENTMVIDIKLLSTKEIRVLLKEMEKIEKIKEELIREEEKKENSHLTVCGSEYSSKCAV